MKFLKKIEELFGKNVLCNLTNRNYMMLVHK
jgi:hypothetical protein